MRIGYISYEYPPDTAFGGIATYVYQASLLMKSRGHDVEVFCSSQTRSITEARDGIIVNRILCLDRRSFAKEIVKVFVERNQEKQFDIIESPEFGGDGLDIKQRYPGIPMVVKLHTPWYFSDQLSNYYLTLKAKVWYMIAGLLRGRIRKRYWIYPDKENDPDYQVTNIADQIQTPSVSLGGIVSKQWNINREDIVNVPYPFIPKLELLAIPIDTNHKVVSYIGRLERRKGLVELVKALPEIFDSVPDFKMRFIGKTEASHIPMLTMQEFILSALNKYKDRIVMMKYPPEEVHLAYAESDICVFPSLWENFPNVCLEAMSAGRGVVGSKFGGMSDMIEDGGSGLLVDPFNTSELAEKVIYLLNHPTERMQMGARARNRVLTAYNETIIGELMEKNYNFTINARKDRIA